MLKVGLSYNCNDFSKLDEMKKAGIYGIELCRSYYGEFEKLDFLGLKKKLDEIDLKLWSMHLPFGPFDKIDISSGDEVLRQNSIMYLCGLIDKGGKIGAKRFVIHTSGEPIADEERKERINNAKKSLTKLADCAEKYGAIICVEDLPRDCLGNCANDLLDLTGDDDRLKICFDTNHIITEQPHDVIKKVGSKIETLHVSDFDFINERHWLPGEGKIDWDKLTKALEEINYNGVWMYEIGFGIPRTILRDRELTPEDFIRSADETLNHKPFTIFSKPKPNLGMWE